GAIGAVAAPHLEIGTEGVDGRRGQLLGDEDDGLVHTCSGHGKPFGEGGSDAPSTTLCPAGAARIAATRPRARPYTRLYRDRPRRTTRRHPIYRARARPLPPPQDRSADRGDAPADAWNGPAAALGMRERPPGHDRSRRHGGDRRSARRGALHVVVVVALHPRHHLAQPAADLLDRVLLRLL